MSIIQVNSNHIVLGLHRQKINRKVIFYETFEDIEFLIYYYRKNGRYKAEIRNNQEVYIPAHYPLHSAYWDGLLSELYAESYSANFSKSFGITTTKKLKEIFKSLAIFPFA